MRKEYYKEVALVTSYILREDLLFGTFFNTFEFFLWTAMSREEILENINKALIREFYGYKGGLYEYNENTPVNFEDSGSSYTDGEYCARMISEIELEEPYEDQETRLVKKSFR